MNQSTARNTQLQKELQRFGLALPNILLPRFRLQQRLKWQRWAVIACDQYTSEPEYWRDLRQAVAQAPSALQAILPEAEIGQTPRQLQDQLSQVRAGSRALSDSSLLSDLAERGGREPESPALILLRRRMARGRVQWGLLIAADLEHYHFDRSCHARAKIQPTEKTVLERLPVRKALRSDSALDFSHALLLYDDSAQTLFRPLIDLAEANDERQLPVIYDFPLYRPAAADTNIHGEVRGYFVGTEEIERILIPALENCERQNQGQNAAENASDLRPLFLVGDGNHSLAAAKQVWEEVKSSADDDDPRRFALVELINFADEAIPFEPIHRLVSFNTESGPSCRNAGPGKRLPFEPLSNPQLTHWFGKFLQILEKESQHNVQLTELPELRCQSGASAPVEDYLCRQCETDPQKWFFLFACEGRILRLDGRSNQARECVRVVQQALDSLDQSTWQLDYIHGAERCMDLAERQNNNGEGHAGAAILLPHLCRKHFFAELAANQVMPRKAFSIGHAEEKRFYIECRKLI